MFRIDEILQATGGALLNAARGLPVKGVSIDSRTLKKGELFLAIRGQNFDGHDFLREAVRKSAAAVVVSKRRAAGWIEIPVILVEDTQKALGDIALFHRLRFPIPVVAITGSTGKTTTKDLVAAVLSRRYKVHKNTANFNNRIGVPLTLLKLNSSHEVLVIELGTSCPGEIKRLSQITRPTVAVLTNIGESHLEFLKTSDGVFKEKLQIVNHMDQQGVVIFNKDDPYLSKISSLKLKQKLISYGIQSPCDYKAEHINLEGNASIHFRLNKKERFILKSSALHMVYNALAALGTARLFGVDVKQVKKAFSQFSPLSHRHCLTRIGSYCLIDDSYNSNPVSLRSAIHSLNSLESRGRKIFVCGDMLELGRHTERLHRQMGRLMAASDVDILLTVGKYSRFMAQAARKKGRLKIHHFPSVVSAQYRLERYLQPHDTIFIKGSRGMHLERMVEFLKEKARP